jgi:hypothetical protein
MLPKVTPQILYNFYQYPISVFTEIEKNCKGHAEPQGLQAVKAILRNSKAGGFTLLISKYIFTNLQC